MPSCSERAYKSGWEHLMTSSLDLAAVEGKDDVPTIVKIGRIGRLFQLMMLVIRQAASPLNIDEVFVDDGKVVLKKRDSAAADSVRALMPYLPRFDDEGARKMGPLKEAGFEALVYLYPTLKEILGAGSRKNFFKNIKEVSVKISDTSDVLPDHFLWKLELENGVIVALDPMGVQFGDDDTVGEWEDLIGARDYTVLWEDDFGDMRDTTFQNLEAGVYEGNEGLSKILMEVRELYGVLNGIVEGEMPDRGEHFTLVWDYGSSGAYITLLESFRRCVDLAVKELCMSEEKEDGSERDVFYETQSTNSDAGEKTGDDGEGEADEATVEGNKDEGEGDVFYETHSTASDADEKTETDGEGEVDEETATTEKPDEEKKDESEGDVFYETYSMRSDAGDKTDDDGQGEADEGTHTTKETAEEKNDEGEDDESEDDLGDKSFVEIPINPEEEDDDDDDDDDEWDMVEEAYAISQEMKDKADWEFVKKDPGNDGWTWID